MQNILIVGAKADGTKVSGDGFRFYFRNYGGGVAGACFDKVILMKKPSTGSEQKWLETIMQTRVVDDSELYDWDV